MKILYDPETPDSDRFTNEDAAPYIDDDNALVLLNGRGHIRSWGYPSVTSTLVFSSPDLVSIHVGINHVRGGSQFWKHYTLDKAGNVTPIAWNKLPAHAQMRIFGAFMRWGHPYAKIPGNRKPANANPRIYPPRTAYDLAIKLSDTRLVSLFKNTMFYVPGETGSSIPGGGSFYCYPSREHLMALIKHGHLTYGCVNDTNYPVVLLEVLVSGNIVEYPSGKLACTSACASSILETINI